MRFRIYAIILISALILGCAICEAQQTSSLMGEYRRFTPHGVGASDQPNLRDGSVAEVEVSKKDGELYIDWGVTRQPPGFLLGSNSPAKLNKDGSLMFAFEDAWGNKGKGTFQKVEKSYLLYLEVTEENHNLMSAGDVRSLYGKWPVDRIQAQKFR